MMPIGAINNLHFSYWQSGCPPFKWRYCYFMKALITKILSTQVSIPRTEIDLLNTVVLKMRSAGWRRSDSPVKIIFLIILKFHLPSWTVLQKHWWWLEMDKWGLLGADKFPLRDLSGHRTGVHFVIICGVEYLPRMHFSVCLLYYIQ